MTNFGDLRSARHGPDMSRRELVTLLASYDGAAEPALNYLRDRDGLLPATHWYGHNVAWSAAACITATADTELNAYLVLGKTVISVRRMRSSRLWLSRATQSLYEAAVRDAWSAVLDATQPCAQMQHMYAVALEALSARALWCAAGDTGDAAYREWLAKCRHVQQVRDDIINVYKDRCIEEYIALRIFRDVNQAAVPYSTIRNVAMELSDVHTDLSYEDILAAMLCEIDAFLLKEQDIMTQVVVKPNHRLKQLLNLWKKNQ